MLASTGGPPGAIDHPRRRLSVPAEGGLPGPWATEWPEESAYGRCRALERGEATLFQPAHPEESCEPDGLLERWTLSAFHRSI
jgi:hypothetical protein